MTPQVLRHAQQEIGELRLRLEEAEGTLRAIRAGEVDSLVVEGPDGPRIYALEGANNSYRVLVEAMNEGAATLTRAGTILYCNHRFAEMLGLPLEKVIGGGIRDHVCSELLDAFDVLLRSGWEQASKGEIVLRKADGALLTVQLSLSALVDGEPILCVVATDLTEQVRAQELRASEERAVSRAKDFEALLNAVPAAVLITRDQQATRIDGNAAAYELLRLPRGGEVSTAAPLPAGSFRVLKDGIEVPPQMMPVPFAAAQGVEVRAVELDLVFEDGGVRNIMGNATPLFDERGMPNGAVGAFIDITERKRAEEALQDADRRKSEFLAVLSHELRTPLTPIRNSLVLLEHAAPGSEQAERAKSVLSRQTEHLTRLVDELLDATRISRGKIALQRTLLDAREVVRSACDDHRPTFEQRQVELRFEEPAGPTWIEADTTRLSQVLWNLLQNAAKFTAPGGTVVVNLNAADEDVELRVRDTGIGMAPHELERVFEPFAQIDDTLARTGGGLGLGLTLVKGLVDLHGGHVLARSAGLGHGSEIVVTFPRAMPPADAAPDLRVATSTSATSTSGRLVLVIEDNMDAAETLGELLETKGHRVHLAYDGTTGILMTRDLKPDVVLCDIGLPDVNGYDVARALRADQSLRSTRLIAVTGYASSADKQKAMEAGFDDHLTKPPDLDKLDRLLAMSEQACRSRPDRPG
jgi:PAS domain S-box-containing protein